MLPLKPFALLCPDSLEEALALLQEPGRKIIAGGTDVLPNLKHGLYEEETFVSLRNIPTLKNFTYTQDQCELFSLVSLNTVATHPTFLRYFPAAASASAHIASPQIRNMGTVGGNICLDTRCVYFNQTAFWRSALGYCLKKDGDCCHVVKTGKRCVAAASNDLATAMLAYNAELCIIKKGQMRTIKLEEFYTANGEKNHQLTHDEMILSVKLHHKTQYSGFFKLRHRRSIDFPLLSVAVCFSLDEHHKLTEGRLILNALVAKPKVMDLAEWKGCAYKSIMVNDIAQKAKEKSHPQSNIYDDVLWRKNMISYSVNQAFNNALSIMD